jgi:hypothetical protein
MCLGAFVLYTKNPLWKRGQGDLSIFIRFNFERAYYSVLKTGGVKNESNKNIY